MSRLGHSFRRVTRGLAGVALVVGVATVASGGMCPINHSLACSNDEDCDALGSPGASCFESRCCAHRCSECDDDEYCVRGPFTGCPECRKPLAAYPLCDDECLEDEDCPEEFHCIEVRRNYPEVPFCNACVPAAPDEECIVTLPGTPQTCEDYRTGQVCVRWPDTSRVGCTMKATDPTCPENAYHPACSSPEDCPDAVCVWAGPPYCTICLRLAD